MKTHDAARLRERVHTIGLRNEILLLRMDLATERTRLAPIREALLAYEAHPVQSKWELVKKAAGL